MMETAFIIFITGITVSIVICMIALAVDLVLAKDYQRRNEKSAPIAVKYDSGDGVMG